jgi:hypothetical protein
VAKERTTAQVLPHGKRGWHPLSPQHVEDIRNFDFTLETALRHRVIEERVSNPEVQSQLVSSRDVVRGQVKPKVTLGEAPTTYFLTNFGVCFLEACRAPKPSDAIT